MAKRANMGTDVTASLRVNLTCPHGHQLKVYRRFGVLVYYHADGKPCATMNEVKATAGKVLGQAARSRDLDVKDPVVLSGFLTSRSVRSAIYRKFEEMDEKSTAVVLMFLIKKARLNRYSPIWDEMSRDFGWEFIANYAHLVGDGQPINTNRPSKFKMANVRMIEINEVINTLDAELQTTTDQLDEAISSISKSAQQWV